MNPFLPKLILVKNPNWCVPTCQLLTCSLRNGKNFIVYFFLTPISLNTKAMISSFRNHFYICYICIMLAYEHFRDKAQVFFGFVSTCSSAFLSLSLSPGFLRMIFPDCWTPKQGASDLRYIHWHLLFYWSINIFHWAWRHDPLGSPFHLPLPENVCFLFPPIKTLWPCDPKLYSFSLPSSYTTHVSTV